MLLVMVMADSGVLVTGLWGSENQKVWIKKTITPVHGKIETFPTRCKARVGPPATL
jgi:hypothetical protein